MAVPPVFCILGRNLGKEMRCILTTFPGVFLQRWTQAAEQWGSGPDSHIFPVSHTPGLEVAVVGAAGAGWAGGRVYRTGKRRLPLCHLAPWSHLVVALLTLPRTVTRQSLTLEMRLVVCGFSRLTRVQPEMGILLRKMCTTALRWTETESPAFNYLCA